MKFFQPGIVTCISLGLSGMLLPAAAQTNQNRLDLRFDPSDIQFIQPVPDLVESPEPLPFPDRTTQTAQSQLKAADDWLDQGIEQLEASNPTPAIQQLQQALAFYQSSIVRQAYPQASRSGEASALNNLGVAYRRTSRYQQAIESFQQALLIFQEIEDRQGEADALTNSGSIYSDLSQHQQAIEYYQQALPIYRAVDDRKGEAGVLNNLGVTYDILEQHQQAIEYFQQALPIYRAMDEQGSQATVLMNLGNAYNKLEQFQRAINYYQQSLVICQQLGRRYTEARVFTNLGLIYGELSQYQLAIDYYRQALPILREIDDRDGEGLLLANIGRLFVAQNSPASAIEQLQKSVEVREAIRADLRGLPVADQQAYTGSIADDYRLLAELLRRQNRSQEAQAILDLL